MVVVVVWIYAMDRFFDAVVAGNNGPVTSTQDWPRPLKELAASAQEKNIDLNDVRVYCIAKGMIVEYVWRMRSSPELFALVQSEFDLYPDTIPAATFAADGATLDWWWKPTEGTSPQFFLGRRSNIAEEGDKFIVLNDEQRQFIYVYYNDDW
jgi:hypothetical protein